MDTRDEVHLAKDEARAGATPGIVRYVLLIRFRGQRVSIAGLRRD